MPDFQWPDGAITRDAYKAMVLQLDPNGADDAEQQLRMDLERKMARDLAAALGDQLDTLIPDNATNDKVAQAPSQVATTSEPVREVLRRSLAQSADLGVNMALDTLENSSMSFDWTLAHGQAADWASRYSFDLVNGINQTTQARLQTAVNDWFREATTIGDLQKELAPLFGKQRAQTIATTETTRAAYQGSVAGYKQSGVVNQVEWVTVNDEKVCSICGPLDEQRAPLDGTFEGGYSVPAHPNCRCFVRPVVETS
jgi:SPP1 gp7 family putative phage head morphogenesis protein